MRILTVVRQVLDAGESVSIKNGGVDLENRKLVMDEMDEYGVEEAIRLREDGADVEIFVLAVGPARVREVLVTALAMGADRALHVETDLVLDAIALSDVVAQIARKEETELIFCGGQQADWDSHALGAAIAERLQWPQVTWTHALKLKDRELMGKHDVDQGGESCELSLPAVITTQQGLNEPRYLTLPNIVKARQKEIRLENLSTFNTAAKLKVTGMEIPLKDRLKHIIDGKDAPAAVLQLVRFLRDKARVIS